METNLVILVMTLFGGCILTVLALKWLSIQEKSPERQKDKVERLEEEIELLQKEINKYRVRATRAQQKFQVEGDYDLDDSNDLSSLAKSIAPGIIDLLPKEAQTHARSLLSNPDLIPLLGEIYEKFPKESKQLLSGFLKNSKSSSGQEDQSSPNQAILFDQGGA